MDPSPPTVSEHGRQAVSSRPIPIAEPLKVVDEDLILDEYRVLDSSKKGRRFLGGHPGSKLPPIDPRRLQGDADRVVFEGEDLLSLSLLADPGRQLLSSTIKLIEERTEIRMFAENRPNGRPRRGGDPSAAKQRPLGRLHCPSRQSLQDRSDQQRLCDQPNIADTDPSPEGGDGSSSAKRAEADDRVAFPL